MLLLFKRDLTSDQDALRRGSRGGEEQVVGHVRQPACDRERWNPVKGRSQHPRYTICLYVLYCCIRRGHSLRNPLSARARTRRARNTQHALASALHPGTFGSLKNPLNATSLRPALSSLQVARNRNQHRTIRAQEDKARRQLCCRETSGCDLELDSPK